MRMASIRCKACGASYHYEKEGCCPNCGAYNRPPKRERINADGTVQHMTDAAYEKRQHAQGKMCFEEKECYEDQARQGLRRVEEIISAVLPRPDSKKKKGSSKSITKTVIGIIILYILFGALGRLTKNDVDQPDPDFPGTIVVDPAETDSGDEDPAEDEYAQIFEEVTMQDGTTFSVWGWEKDDEEKELVVLVDAVFAEDSAHTYYATLKCTDPSGEEEALEGSTAIWDEDGFLQLHYPSDRYDELSPAFLELEEWEDGNLILSRIVDLR